MARGGGHAARGLARRDRGRSQRRSSQEVVGEREPQRDGAPLTQAPDEQPPHPSVARRRVDAFWRPPAMDDLRRLARHARPPLRRRLIIPPSRVPRPRVGAGLVGQRVHAAAQRGQRPNLPQRDLAAVGQHLPAGVGHNAGATMGCNCPRSIPALVSAPPTITWLSVAVMNCPLNAGRTPPSAMVVRRALALSRLPSCGGR